MAMRLNTRHLKGFVSEHELAAIEPQVHAAHKLLTEKSGLGNDFLGWTDLPTKRNSRGSKRLPKRSRPTVMC